MELFKNSKLKYLVVANDAGAAYHIYYFIKKFKIKCNYFLQGPAKKIFKKKNVNSLANEIKKNDIVFTGTSLKTKLEVKTIKQSKLLNKKVLSIIDNYNNFKKRFLIKGKLYYPETIIAIDSLSYQEAKRYKKKNFKLVKKKDYFLEFVRKLKQKPKKKNIIYFSSNYDRISKKEIDLKLLESFCIKLKKLKLLINNRKIYIKLHPSEKKTKYVRSKILKKFDIKIEKNLNIIKIFKNYQIAAGCETYALALSKAYGLKTFNNVKNFNIKPILGKLYKIKNI